MTTSRSVMVDRWRRTETGAESDRRPDVIAAEVPVALTYNRVSHVVMMATPADLEDFALGFSLTEGLVGSREDLLQTRIIPREGGLEVAMQIGEEWFDRLATQRRNMAGRTGCGLCGAENIEQALRSPRAVNHTLMVGRDALERALETMNDFQPLQAETGATHGAAWCTPEGQIIRLREDVGRHNALDKLIGCLVREDFDPDSGFVLVSSRASFEMVYKSAAAGMQLVMAVSAPTTLAVEFAQRSGITLVGFARPGRHNVYTFAERIGTGPDEE